MTEFLPRSAWTSDPSPGGVATFVASQVEGLAVHWPGGSGSVPTSKAATIRILQGELDYHTKVKGWSDIAYNFAVDQEGRVWELRGMRHRSAANGDTDVNTRFVAVTCLIGPRDIPSAKLLQAVRDLRKKMLATYPKATKVVPHSAIRPSPTDCPGDALRAHIADGTFTRSTDVVTPQPPVAPTPVPVPEPKKKEIDMRVVQVAGGRTFIVGGPLSGEIVVTNAAGARDESATAALVASWCTVAEQDAPIPVSSALVANTTTTRTFAAIQEFARTAATRDAVLDVEALAERLAAVLPADLAQQFVDAFAARLARPAG